MNQKDRKIKRSVVQSRFKYGLYAWQMPDGKVLGQNGDVLNIPAREGDIRAMSQLRQYVIKELGISEGKPVFLGGVTRLTDSQHDDQMEQLLDGYVPDMDIDSMIDDYEMEKRRGNN